MSFCHHIPGVKCQNCNYTYTQSEMLSHIPIEYLKMYKKVEDLQDREAKLCRIIYALKTYKEGTRKYMEAVEQFEEMI